MKKLMVAIAAAAISFAGVAGTWFEAGFGQSAESTGGAWSVDEAGVSSAPTWSESTLVLEDVEDPVIFAATDSKSAADGTVEFSTSVSFEGFSELPEIDSTAKAGVCALADGNYYVVGYENETKKWIDTGIAATLGTDVNLTVTVTNGVAAYQFGDALPFEVAIDGNEFQQVSYLGNGSVTALAGNYDEQLVTIVLPEIEGLVATSNVERAEIGATVQVWFIDGENKISSDKGAYNYTVGEDGELSIVDGQRDLPIAQDPAAKIGTVLYLTLDGALEAAGAGKTVVVMKDATVESLEAIKADITIDANGYVVALADAEMTLTNNVTIVCSGETAEKGVKNDAQITIAAGKTLDLSTLSWAAGVIGSDAGTAHFTLEAGAVYKQGLGNWDDTVTNIFSAVEGYKITLAKDASVAMITTELLTVVIDFTNAEVEGLAVTYDPSVTEAVPGTEITATYANDTKIVTGSTTAVYVVQADGTLELKAGESKPTATDPAAKIGTVLYLTLDAALDAAGAGETVVVMKDATVESLEAIKADITIDANGYVVALADAEMTLTNNVTIVCSGETAEKGVKNDAQITIAAGKTLDLSTLSWAAGVIGSDAGTAHFTLEAGAVYKQGLGNWDDTVTNIFSAVEGYKITLAKEAGVATISTESAAVVIDFTNAEVAGLAVTYDPSVTEAVPGTEITATYANDTKIGSGTRVFVVQPDGSLELKAGEDPKPVPQDPAAKIGTVLYLTLDAALEAAGAGETVVVMKDATVESLEAIKADIKIDANGNVVSLANAAMTLTNNVTIVCSGETLEKGVKNDAQITIAAGKTLDLSTLSWAAGVIGSDAGTAHFTLEAGAVYKQGLGTIWNDEITNIFTAVEGYGVTLAKDESVATITTEILPVVKPFYIGETGYDTWADAIAAAKDGDTIRVAEDVVTAGGMPKSITIDLDGHDLEITGGWWYSAITVIDSNQAVEPGSINFSCYSMNVSSGTLDLSALDSDQVAGMFQMNATSVIKFPVDRSFDDCKSAVYMKAIGSQIVVQGVTYTWDGAKWASEIKPFAIIDGVTTNYYETLAEAVAAVAENGTISVMEDVTIEDLEAITKDLTIDANGNVVSLANAEMTLTNNVTIICSGETAEKGVKNDAQITIAAGKTLDLSTLSWAAGVIGSDAGTASFTLEAGAVYKQGLGTIWNDEITNIFSAVEGYKITLAKDASVATIATELLPVVIDFTNAEVEGLAVTYDPSVTEAVPGTEITATYANDTKIVTGSTTAVYVVQADGTLALKAGESKPTATDPAAKIGTVLYLTLDAALEAAGAGETVVVMKDATVESLEAIKADIKIDANGNVVSLANAAMTLTNNVTIICSGETAEKGVKNDAQITIAAGKTLDLSTLSWAAGVIGSDAGTAHFTLEAGAVYKQGLGTIWNDEITNIFSAVEGYKITLAKEAGVATITTELVKTYPSYIPDDPEVKAAFDTWAEKYGRDPESVNMDAFLLDCDPAEVETAKAAFKVTSIELVDDVWVVKACDKLDGEKYKNGYVNIKPYEITGAASESAFYQATLTMYPENDK